MCGRYALELAQEHPQYMAGVELTDPITNYNVAPTSTVPILVDRLVAPTEQVTGAGELPGLHPGTALGPLGPAAGLGEGPRLFVAGLQRPQ